MKYILYVNEVATNAECRTKLAVKVWCNTGVENRGLDWRVGYLIKFRDSSDVYEWKTQDGKKIK